MELQTIFNQQLGDVVHNTTAELIEYMQKNEVTPATARPLLKQAKTIIKQVEEARKQLTKPLLDKKREIDQHAKDIIATLQTECDTLNNKVSEYLQKEEARKAIELQRIEDEKNAKLKEAQERDQKALEIMHATRDKAIRYLQGGDFTILQSERDRWESIDWPSDIFTGAILKQAIKMQYEVLNHFDNCIKSGRPLALVTDKQDQSALIENQMQSAIDAETTSQAQAQAITTSEGGRKTWTFEIEDADQVPNEFKTIDEKAIRQAIKDGAREIKGLKIYQKITNVIR